MNEARWAKRLVVAASGLLVCAPMVVAIIAWRGGWMPQGDDASSLIRSWDTLSRHPPMLGTHSSATAATDTARELYHPGPLQQWLLAVPLHLGAPSPGGALIGGALLSAIAVAVVLFAAWRRGGMRVLAAANVMTGLWMVAAGSMALYEPLSTPLSSIALLAALAAAWAAIDSDPWFLPIAVFMASMAMQPQVAFTLPVVGVLGVLAIDCVVCKKHRNWAAIVTAVVVGIVTWIGPIYDQFFESGNLWALATSSGKGTKSGAGSAMTELVGALSFPPSWVFHDLRLAVNYRGATPLLGSPSILQYGTAGLFVCVFVLLLVRSFHSDNATIWKFGVMALVGLGTAWVTTAFMPNDAFSIFGHREVWRSVGMFSWLFVVCALTTRTSKVSIALNRIARPTRLMGGVALIVAAGALASLGALVWHANPARNVGSAGYGVVQRFGAAAVKECTKGTGPVLVNQSDFFESPTSFGVMMMLELNGCIVHVDPQFSTLLPGPLHQMNGHETVTFLVSGVPKAPSGFVRIATYDPMHPPPKYRGFQSVLHGLQQGGTQYLFVRRT